MTDKQAMEVREKTLFERGYQLDCSEHVEKKGGFDYLSWSWAWAEAKKLVPDFRWGFRAEGPVDVTSAGWFVVVGVCSEEEKLDHTEWMPILDNRNRPIENPSTFDINTSARRALVKAIATVTGIGLYIYHGEMAPPDAPAPELEVDVVTFLELSAKDGLKPLGEALRSLDKNQKRAVKLNPEFLAKLKGVAKEVNNEKAA